MKRQIRFVCIFALAGTLAFLLAACGYSTSTALPDPTSVPTQTPTPTKALAKAEVAATAAAISANRSLKNIDEAEQKWKAQNIASYRIIVRWSPNFWVQYRIEGIVRNGEITGQSAACIPIQYSEKGKCPAPGFSSASGVVVPALFDTARKLVAEEQASKLKGLSNYFVMFLNPTYSFPEKMYYKITGVTDSDSAWEVELFEVLK